MAKPERCIFCLFVERLQGKTASHSKVSKKPNIRIVLFWGDISVGSRCPGQSGDEQLQGRNGPYAREHGQHAEQVVPPQHGGAGWRGSGAPQTLRGEGGRSWSRGQALVKGGGVREGPRGTKATLPPVSAGFVLFCFAYILC